MFLDVHDLQLIDLLKQNSRAKLTELANNLNLSAATIKNRIEKLVEWGVIDKFTISINRKKIGYEISAYLVINAVNKIYLNKIIKNLEEFTEIAKISVLMGDPDIIAVLNAYSMENIVNFLKKMSQIAEIQTFKTWFVMDEINTSNNSFLKEKRNDLASESTLKKVRSNI